MKVYIQTWSERFKPICKLAPLLSLEKRGSTLHPPTRRTGGKWAEKVESDFEMIAGAENLFYIIADTDFWDNFVIQLLHVFCRVRRDRRQLQLTAARHQSRVNLNSLKHFPIWSITRLTYENCRSRTWTLRPKCLVSINSGLISSHYLPAA